MRRVLLASCALLALSSGAAASIDMSGFTKRTDNVPSSYWSQWASTHSVGMDDASFMMLYVWPDIIDSNSGYNASTMTGYHINTVWFPSANSNLSELRSGGLLAISGFEEWIDGTSSSNVTIPASTGGTLAFAVTNGNTQGWHTGDKFLIYSSAGYTSTTSTNYIMGTFVSYSSGTLTVTVNTKVGSGAHTDWIVALIRAPATGNTGFGSETVGYNIIAEGGRLMGYGGSHTWSEHFTRGIDGSPVEPGYNTCLNPVAFEGCWADGRVKIKNRFPDSTRPVSLTADFVDFAEAWSGAPEAERAETFNGNGGSWAGSNFFTYDGYIDTVAAQCASNHLGALRDGTGPVDGFDSLHRGQSSGRALTAAECHRAWNYGLYAKEFRRLDGLDGNYQPIIGQVEAVSAEYDGGANTLRISGVQIVGAVFAQFIEGVDGMGYFQYSDNCDGHAVVLALRDASTGATCNADHIAARPYITATNAWLQTHARMIHGGRYVVDLSQAELSYATWLDPVDSTAHIIAIQKNDHDSGTYQLTLPGALCEAATVTVTHLQDMTTASGTIDGSCHLSVAFAHEYDAYDIKLDGNVPLSPPPPPPTPPTLSFAPSLPSIPLGGTTSLVWTSTDTTSCSASDGWTGAKTVAGSELQQPSITTTYTLTCPGDGGTITRSVTVTVIIPPGAGTLYIATSSLTSIANAINNPVVYLSPCTPCLKSSVSELRSAVTTIATLRNISPPTDFPASGPIYLLQSMTSRVKTQLGQTYQTTHVGRTAMPPTPYASASAALAALNSPDP